MLTFTFWSTHCQESVVVFFSRTMYNFQFQVLPFSLSVSPRIFMRVVDAMMAHVRSLGFQVHYYLDEWLLRNQQVEYLRNQTQCLLLLTARLGRIPNQEKSEFTPTQDFVFIGIHNWTDLDLMFPREVCFREAACHPLRVIRAKYVTAQDFLSLLGRLVSMSDLVLLGHLRYRPLQLYLLAHWCHSQGQLSDRITLDHPFLDPFLSCGPSHPMFFKGSLSQLLFPSWLYTQMPSPTVEELTAAVSQQQTFGCLPRWLATSMSWSY